MTFTIQSRDAFANPRVHGYYDAGRNEFQGAWFKSNVDMRRHVISGRRGGLPSESGRNEGRQTAREDDKAYV